MNGHPLRQRVEKYVASGRGAQSKLAAAAGVSAETIRRLRANEKLSVEYLNRIRDAVDALESTAHESESDYDTDKWSAVIDELESTLRLLRRPGASLDAAKVERLGSLFGVLHALAEAAGVSPDNFGGKG